MGLRILIVDDHMILRQGLVALLHSQLPAAETREASDGVTAVRIAAEWSPDVVLMDISMPHLDGLDATRQILAHQPAPKILVLTGHGGGQLAAAAMKAGAMGFIAKESAFEELAAAIRTVVAGKYYVSHRIHDTKPESSTAAHDDADDHHSLTSRERDVLELLADGQAMKEIAHNLHVSIKTVETHRRKIMDKLGIYSVAELTKYAMKVGLTPLYGVPLKPRPGHSDHPAPTSDGLLTS